MRVESGRHKVDSSGCDYWVHHLDGAAVPPPDRPELVVSPALPRAPVETLNEVYGALLASLSLSTAHRENLRARGLPDAEIERREYRTLPARGRAALARRLVDRFGAEVCHQIPGLYVREEAGRVWWSLAGHAGLLIPVRDLAVRVVALKVRADDDGAPFRYSYVSSRGHGGPGPGAPPHVPLYHGDVETVRLTEGELKADVCTVLTGMLTLSVAGVSHYRTALPLLWKLGTKIVHLAFDMDWQWKPVVARALDGAAEALDRAGHIVMIETWEV